MIRTVAVAEYGEADERSQALGAGIRSERWAKRPGAEVSCWLEQQRAFGDGGLRVVYHGRGEAKRAVQQRRGERNPA